MAMWIPINIPPNIAKLSGKLLDGFSRKQTNQVALYCFYKCFADNDKIEKVRSFLITEECKKIVNKLKKFT